MNNGIILMTALPPSKGHLQLIRWASNFGINKLDVLVCGRLTDPIHVWERAYALCEACSDLENVRINEFIHDYPDYPEQFNGTVEEFDRAWVDAIENIIPFDSEDFLFASDSYGSRFADKMGVKFAPYDPNRETIAISGTKIRRNPFETFDMIVPAMRKKLQMTVTVFGAESTGKTTTARSLANNYNSYYLSEWARPYLESLEDPKVTDDRMEMIVRGQMAAQCAAKQLNDTPFIFQDTDLFSTFGYYKLYDTDQRRTRTDTSLCLQKALQTKADLYIVMNSNIRFTPDPLRYGLNKRESTDQYWIDILEKYNCNYYYVRETNIIAQKDAIEQIVKAAFYKKNPVFGFERV